MLGREEQVQRPLVEACLLCLKNSKEANLGEDE